MRPFLPTLVLGSGLALSLAACSNDTTSPPPPPPGVCTGTPFTLASLQGKVMPVADVPCLSIPADGGTYLIVPQFPTANAPVTPVNFTLSAGPAGATAVVTAEARRAPPIARIMGADMGKAQRDFEGKLRRREGSVAAAARSGAAPGGPLANRVRAAVVPPSSKTFHVLSDFSSGDVYELDTANLKFTGSHLLIYQSKNAPAPPNGFTDAEITAIGNTFDQDLYTIDVATFGTPTDIDSNGRVIVLLSPIINKLTDESTCSSQGFIAGFFNAIDLLPGQFPNSNGDEVFYALVPDPTAAFSCAHSIAATGELTSSTFIHEFQHMISFGQHVIMRNGSDEDAWLNEGLSHVAEELGSRFYEKRFPPPTGRSDPDQAFPDSSQGFISGDLFNSYHFLFDLGGTPDTNDKPSVSNWGSGDGTLVQRGGSWLFLRWLGDQQDSLIYGRLDQTTNTGIPNVQAASGTPFGTLFGEFALALYVDSLPGVPREDIPAEFRFTSRNLRALYGKQSVRNPANFPVEFPIGATPLAPGSAKNSSMFPGTMDFFLLTAPTSGGATVLNFTPTNGTAFNSNLHAQVSVFHCPSASACPLTVQ